MNVGQRSALSVTVAVPMVLCGSCLAFCVCVRGCACSNNKNLVWLDWHPTNRSWIATSVVQDLVFESRVDMSGRASVSHIVIYSFAEFSAQIVLEAPLDIFCFKWNPWQPNLIAAGCSSGQVLLYDLSDAMATVLKAKTKSTKSLHTTSSSTESVRASMLMAERIVEGLSFMPSSIVPVAMATSVSDVVFWNGFQWGVMFMALTPTCERGCVATCFAGEQA